MNFKAFLVGIVIIIVVILGYMLYAARQPLEPEGSLMNVEISPTPIGEPEPAISSTVQGLP